MIQALARFAETLRASGVAASPSEMLDAARALEALGLEDRARFKAALRATLAKDRKQAEAFDRAFDTFFATPARGRGDGNEGRRGGGGEARGAKVTRSGDATHLRKPPPQAEPNGERPRTVSKRPAAKERGERRPAEQRARERMLARLRQDEAAPRGRLRIVRPPSSRTRQHPAPAPAAARTELRRIPLRDLTNAEEAALAREIPKLLTEIRLRTARRYARSARGRLWPARVLRSSLRTGGVPFVLPFRSRRLRRSRVVLLVDVSWSTARAAGLFLWIASELLRIGRDTRVLAFVDRVADVTHAVARWSKAGPPAAAESAAQGTRPHGGPRGAGRRRKARPGTGLVRRGRSFADLLENARDLDLDAPSDYGRAFHGVLSHGLPLGGRDTILVILGDGRSNRFDPLPWTLAEVRRRCRAVVWLAPEPAARWGTGDSRLPDYLPCVDVLVEADNLDGIARGVAEILRRK